MLNTLFINGELALMLASCAFAWWKGGPAERWGAAWLLLSWAVLIISYRTTHIDPRWTLLTTDTCLGAAFLLLALRYSSGWLGAAMVVQGAILSLNAWRWAEVAIDNRPYILANNVLNLGLLAILIAGTVTSWRKRAQIRRKLQANIVPELVSSPA